MNRTYTIALIALLAACKKAPEPEALAEAAQPVESAAKPPTRVAPADRDAAIELMVQNFARVHFALDKHDVDEAGLAALDDNARIMSEFPRLAVEIQGHADERGTTEYNLALGERRAQAVHDRMVMMGVSPSRLAATSFGEEVPLDRDTGEVAWSANRRAEFRITVSDDALVRGTVE